jgi:hypothetical protein
MTEIIIYNSLDIDYWGLFGIWNLVIGIYVRAGFLR